MSRPPETPPPPSERTAALVKQTLAGDRGAQRRLIEEVLAPVVQARVARILLRRGAARRNLREEMKDLAQEALLHVFETGSLAHWDPARGPLLPFVGRIVENKVLSILRSRIRNPWTEVPTEHEDLEGRMATTGAAGEGAAVSRDALRAIAAGLGDDDLELFFLFFVEERTSEEVSAVTGRSAEAVHKQRQRLRERARKIVEEAVSSPRVPPRNAGGDTP